MFVVIRLGLGLGHRNDIEEMNWSVYIKMVAIPVETIQWSARLLMLRPSFPASVVSPAIVSLKAAGNSDSSSLWG